MVTGATGEMSAPPKAGDSLTDATGGGTTVVDGELGALLLEDSVPLELSAADAAAGLAPPVLWTAARPEDEPEQAAVAARTPPTITAMAARRVVLERWSFNWSSGQSAAGVDPVGHRFVLVLEDARDGRTLTPIDMITRAARSHRTPRGDSPARTHCQTPTTSRVTPTITASRIRQADRRAAQAGRKT